MSRKWHTISITYPENYENLFRKIIDTAQLPRISNDQLFSLELAIVEAVNNALVHGNKKSPEKKVKIDYRYGEGVFEITVEDQGEGFESHKIPNPLLDSNLRKDHGRGIMLIEHYMDEVSFNEKGNRISMRKNITPL